MKITKTIIGAILVIASVSTYAMASSCDSAEKAKCHDKAVKHTKTAKGESVCPVAIWAAEAVGPDGKVLDEAVMIWETADGSTWIAKKVKPAPKNHKHAHAVKTADGKNLEPMTCADAASDKNTVKMDIVKSATPCKEKGSDKCDATEHAKSVNGKAIVCSSADKKDADKKLTAEAKNNVANDGYFLVIEED